MTALPLVSVVIPTHGRPEQLRRAIASVIEQDYRGAIEIVVVHDGESADHSLASDAADRGVRVVANDVHSRGLPGARNAGVDEAKGELVASLDDDDLWLPGKLSKQVDLLIAHPEVLVVGSGVVLRTAGGRETNRIPPAVVTRELLLRSRVPELHSSNLLMRRSVFSLVGGYHEDVPIPEDYDWLLRLSEHSRILSVPEPLIWVDRSRPLGSGDRWRYRAIGREKLINLHPELVADRAAAGRMYGRIAFSYAAAHERRNAVRWLRKAARLRQVDRWVVTTILVLAGVPARWVELTSGRLGKSV